MCCVLCVVTIVRTAAKVPAVGDHVIAYHAVTKAYYPATVQSFDPVSTGFVVSWDDGDSTGREMEFDRVALDSTPKEDEVGVGTIVLFPQGRYKGTAGNNAGGERWHQGRITKIEAGRFSGVYGNFDIILAMCLSRIPRLCTTPTHAV